MLEQEGGCSQLADASHHSLAAELKKWRKFIFRKVLLAGVGRAVDAVAFVDAAGRPRVAGRYVLISVPCEVLNHRGDHSTPVPPGSAGNEDEGGSAGSDCMKDATDLLGKQPDVVGVVNRIIEVGAAKGRETRVARFFCLGRDN